MGSEFHWDPHLLEGTGPQAALPSPCVLVGSGRDALRLIFAHGRAVRRWTRVLVPSYFCQEVVAAIVATGLDVSTYSSRPWGPEADLPGTARRTAVLWVNVFGLRPALPRVPEGAELIEDHTHDPWSRLATSSRADFCLASLRKTLPVPDGGLLWSPKQHRLPDAPGVTATRARAAAAKLAGMTLKALYLQGSRVDKETYRRLLQEGEDAIATEPSSAMTVVSRAVAEAAPVEAWRAVRRRNHARLAQALKRVAWCDVLTGPDEDACPFSLIVRVDQPGRREHLRQRLIEHRIYPAVLWPLEAPVVDVERADVELSRRLLSFHCDFRYSEVDLDRLVEMLCRFGEEWRG